MKNINILLDNTDKEFSIPILHDTYANDIKKIVKDVQYLNFLTNESNGGFFFNRSLQLYSLSDKNAFNDIFVINETIKSEYNNILKGEFFFGQEIFGNQFGFSPNGIVFFNIETGERTYMGENFKNWVEEVVSDLDFYTGRNIIDSWSSSHKFLNFDERLCPTIPFVIGGEYEVDNLYNSAFPNYILSNSNIARQVYDLPEGTSVKLKEID